MAITFVSSSKVAGGNANVGSIILPDPGGIQDDDLIIIVACRVFESTPQLVKPAGFTDIYAAAGGGAVDWLVTSKVAASESGGYTIVNTGTVRRMVGALGVYRGVNPLNPIHASSPNGFVSGGSTVTADAAISTLVNTLAIRLGAARDQGVIAFGNWDVNTVTREKEQASTDTFGGKVIFGDDLIPAIGSSGVRVVGIGEAGQSHFGATVLLEAELPTGGGAVSFMGDAATLPRTGERIQRADGYKIPIPKGTRLKNPVRKIIDPWGELKD